MADDRGERQAHDTDPDGTLATPQEDGDGPVAPAVLPAYPFVMGVVGGACLGLGANLAVAARSGALVWSGASGLMAGLVLAAAITITALLDGEVFAGSHGATVAWFRGKVTVGRLSVHMFAVWIGNLVGALAPIWLLVAGGQYAVLKYGIGEAAVSLAAAECSSPFLAVLVRAVLGGALMCIAFWLVAGASRPTDKFIVALLPALGIAAGALPHVVVSSHIVVYGLAANWLGAVAEGPENLTFGAFLGRCLVPGTLGNLIGAALALAGLHWVTHIRPRLAERTTDRPSRRRPRPPRDGEQTEPRREPRRRPRHTRRTRTRTTLTPPDEEA